MAHIISLANGKGGVAKTTTCIALGSSLAKMGYRILLVDLDPSGNLTAGLGVAPEQSADFSQDLFISDYTRLIHPTKTGYQNLDIIPSKGNIVSMDGKSTSTTSLRLALESSSLNPYDLIILDCPAALGHLTVSALTASDLLIIPTQPEYFSTMALPTMLSMVDKIRGEKNPDLEYRILVTMLDLRLNEHREILSQLRMRSNGSLYRMRIQIDTHFKESQSQGIPISYATPVSRGALQYNDLAHEIVKDLKLDQGQKEDLKAGALNPVALAQTVPTTPDDNYQSQQNGIGEYHCSHLGLFDDPQTIHAYPSTWNKCYRAKPAITPNYTHQQLYCISNNYRTCPMLRKSKKASLPSNLRAPLERSELLQYFKSWIWAKIS